MRADGSSSPRGQSRTHQTSRKTRHCTRVVTGGECSEHGAVDGEFDLRIKAVIDDGHTAQECLFTRGITEEVTGIDLEEAKELAADALDFTVVSDRFTNLLIPLLGRYLLVEEVEETPERAFSDGYEEAVVELLAEHNYDGPGLTAASIEDLPRSYDAHAGGVGGD